MNHSVGEHSMLDTHINTYVQETQTCMQYKVKIKIEIQYSRRIDQKSSINQKHMRILIYNHV